MSRLLEQRVVRHRSESPILGERLTVIVVLVVGWQTEWIMPMCPEPAANDVARHHRLSLGDVIVAPLLASQVVLQEKEVEVATGEHVVPFVAVVLNRKHALAKNPGRELDDQQQREHLE